MKSTTQLLNSLMQAEQDIGRMQGQLCQLLRDLQAVKETTDSAFIAVSDLRYELQQYKREE